VPTKECKLFHYQRGSAIPSWTRLSFFIILPPLPRGRLYLKYLTDSHIFQVNPFTNIYILIPIVLDWLFSLNPSPSRRMYEMKYRPSPPFGYLLSPRTYLFLSSRKGISAAFRRTSPTARALQIRRVWLSFLNAFLFSRGPRACSFEAIPRPLSPPGFTE